MTSRKRTEVKTLIVDDSIFMRDYLRHLGEKMGMECEEAGDGRHALDMLRSTDDFELVLLDVNMPVMNGLECVRMMRATGLGSGAKVMMVTTAADNALVQGALEAGADEYLTKPFTVDALREKLCLMGFVDAA